MRLFPARPKPKFKVGDRVRIRCNFFTFRVAGIKWIKEKGEFNIVDSWGYWYWESELELVPVCETCGQEIGE